ncbi:polysaccharide deacetylase family protein [Pedobacter mucosus]|uniref:polysaccharide deacetylase family protein n=1 Tax=Pedobacter mucosus TaxID=2895286 RepID=UPI001EE44C13|nr:polysaccharide deacetylase family protein [Pedobacter mucosus]UKT63953.1 polysaccharide deacetylase family protein [Pedobacter mucosus]
MIKTITTSWDDGHPLDFRLAELLEKYNLKGTFYVPKNNPQNKVMNENDLNLLGKRFEIGGHTLNHVNLKNIDLKFLKPEIEGSYHWIKDVTGKNPSSFCPPFGAYNNSVIEVIKQAGFSKIRSTQLLSINPPNPVAHTTIQMYSHTSFTYTKHLLKRARINGLMFWLSKGTTSNLLKLADIYLEQVEQIGGNFHLWGHSWEIEKYNLWLKLEELLKHLSNRNGYQYIENKDL